MTVASNINRALRIARDIISQRRAHERLRAHHQAEMVRMGQQVAEAERRTQEACERERDALESGPTQHAYDQVCKALVKAKESTIGYAALCVTEGVLFAGDCEDALRLARAYPNAGGAQELLLAEESEESMGNFDD